MFFDKANTLLETLNWFCDMNIVWLSHLQTSRNMDKHWTKNRLSSVYFIPLGACKISFEQCSLSKLTLFLRHWTGFAILILFDWLICINIGTWVNIELKIGCLVCTWDCSMHAKLALSSVPWQFLHLSWDIVVVFAIWILSDAAHLHTSRTCLTIKQWICYLVSTWDCSVHLTLNN